MTVDRASFFASNAGTTTCNTGTFTDHVSLIFTPKATTNYFVMASSIVDFTGGVQNPNWRLQNITGSTTFATHDYHANGGCGHGITQWTSTTATSTNFKIQINNGGGSDTLTTSFGSLLVIEKGANDQYGATTGTATTTSTSFQVAETITFTPPSSGDYLIIAFAECLNNSSIDAVEIKLTAAGTDYGLKQLSGPTLSYMPWSTIVRKTLSGSTTLSISYRASSGNGTSTVRNRQIIAIRLGDFYNNYYIESRTSQSSSTGAFVDVPGSTLTATTQAFDHITIGSLQSIPNNFTNGDRIVVNSVNKGSPTSVSNGTNYCYFFPWKETLTAASHTSKFQQENGAAKDVAISMFQTTGVPTATFPTPNFLLF